MDKYTVKLLPKAYRDIDQIYGYIIEEFKEPEVATNIAKSIEDSILGLDEYPYRGVPFKKSIELKYQLIFNK
ncbi:UNVERIFIED_CONTAM: Plasmid stabilization system protein [Acetivibrio alkalicellulosi]